MVVKSHARPRELPTALGRQYFFRTEASEDFCRFRANLQILYLWISRDLGSFITYGRIGLTTKTQYQIHTISRALGKPQSRLFEHKIQSHPTRTRARMLLRLFWSAFRMFVWELLAYQFGNHFGFNVGIMLKIISHYFGMTWG